MDNRELLQAIKESLDEKIDVIRADLKDIAVTQKDHEVRLVKVEGMAGFIKASLAITISGIGTVLGYLAYKFIDIWTQKS